MRGAAAHDTARRISDPLAKATPQAIVCCSLIIQRQQGRRRESHLWARASTVGWQCLGPLGSGVPQTLRLSATMRDPHNAWRGPHRGAAEPRLRRAAVAGGGCNHHPCPLAAPGSKRPALPTPRPLQRRYPMRISHRVPARYRGGLCTRGGAHHHPRAQRSASSRGARRGPRSRVTEAGAFESTSVSTHHVSESARGSARVSGCLRQGRLMQSVGRPSPRPVTMRTAPSL